MIYKLDYKLKPNPILPWVNTFWCLSVKQFQQVYSWLDFPFSPPDDLRQVAHDFSLVYISLLPDEEYARGLELLLNNSETASIDLLHGTSPDDPYVKKRDALFSNAFTHLEQLGYAEAVYEWGKQTENYIKYADRQKLANLMALGNWCHLLREWAVLEWMQQRSVSEHELSSSDWNDVLDYFVPIYTEINLTRELLLLSPPSRTILQAIILDHEARKLRLRMITDEMTASPQNVWDEVAFHYHATAIYIQLEGYMRISLHEWSAIVDVLSADEMHILEQWALRYENISGRKLKIPLPDFRT